MDEQNPKQNTPINDKNQPVPAKIKPQDQTEEHGGADTLEPTRYGDWEKNGRCIDF